MSIIGSINGWPLIALPSTPGPRQIDWSRFSVVGAVTNPFTQKQQIQNWQAGLFKAVVTLPPLSIAQAGAWEAFLDQAQGQNAVFFIGDNLRSTPQGSAEGTGVTAGFNAAPYTLTTTGWTGNQPTLLMPGDWVQVGNRLYRCLDAVASDGAGNASFAIWPNLRENPAAGTPVVTTNAQGLFRMDSNTLRSSESYNRTVSLSFSIREAI